MGNVVGACGYLYNQIIKNIVIYGKIKGTATSGCISGFSVGLDNTTLSGVITYAEL